MHPLLGELSYCEGFLLVEVNIMPDRKIYIHASARHELRLTFAPYFIPPNRTITPETVTHGENTLTPYGQHLNMAQSKKDPASIHYIPLPWP